MPSFSIIIPTRNRGDLVHAALTSAVWQEGADVEILLSDNSTSCESVTQCRAAAAFFAHDPRVRYIRPPEPMAMPDHWEFATSQASGSYLLILTDRFVMRPGTLAILQRRIDRDPAGAPEILMWRGEAGYTSNGGFSETAYSGQRRSRAGNDVLAEFANCAQWRSTLLGSNGLPRGLNSAVRRDVLSEVRKRFGRAYSPLSPDYTSAFRMLALGSRQVELDYPFYVAHGSVSNGASIMRDGVAGYTDQFDLDPFEGCPLSIDTVVNTTIRDYLWVTRTTGLMMPPIDPVGYLLINYRELQLKRELGSPLDVQGMRREILEAAERLGPRDKAAFAAGREFIDSRETAAFRARNFLAGKGWLASAQRMAMGLGLYGRVSGPRYADVLEAARAVPLQPWDS